jgi:hypothetical protein
MSREKQIERDAMEKVIADAFMADYNIGCDPCPGTVADALYLENYRKQSEGEWKQTTEPLGAHDVDCVECSDCGESWVLDEDFDYDVVKDFWNYCPNCGARMGGGEE